ncbi:MAG: ABC transporter substrate-binding protein, partial [Chloroflexota bacterium]
HWALNPQSEASRLVNGREFTTDDYVFHLKRVITDTTAYVYRSNLELRTANITKTGPREVAVKVTLDAMISAIGRFGDSIQMVAPEVVTKYGGQGNWKNSVGTGPFMLVDYVPGSSVTLNKNPNYWEKDPIGPGKGNQLPYLDRTMFFIITDASTRLAAMRTGKIDTLGSISIEDAKMMRKQNPSLKEVTTSGGGTPNINYRTDKPPFNDVRVRRAMHLAIDFKAISNALFEGQGTYPGRPFPYDKNYAGLYLGLDDPEMPADVSDLWNYRPEKAKQLLKEAGYPNGFKTSVLLTSSEVDNWAIYKDMLAKVGIDVAFDVRESGVYNNVVNNKQHEAMVSSSGNPLGVWYSMPAYSGTSTTNRSMVNDTVINDTMTKIRLAFINEGETKAFQMMKDLTKYIYGQVYEISGVSGPTSRFWWPWLKNYSGEANVGYFEQTFPTWVWIDQTLKKSMGY